MVLRLCIASVLILSAPVPAPSQEAPTREADNPFQEEVPLRIGTPVEPGVEIAGVRWRKVEVRTKSGADPDAGRDIATLVELEFDNRSDAGVTLTVVVLLEEETGVELERLALPEFRLGGNREKSYREKFTVPGDDLLATRKAYLYCRVE